jgi:hypothetical protein
MALGKEHFIVGVLGNAHGFGSSSCTALSKCSTAARRMSSNDGRVGQRRRVYLVPGKRLSGPLRLALGLTRGLL